ncbi:MAG: ABC transporter substrate-binding protein [Promethearchaeota archaeon]
MKKKVIIVLAILIVICFPLVESTKINSNNPRVFENASVLTSETTIIPFIVGSMYVMEDLDPQYAWDSASFDTFDQVCEGLFKYNLSHPSHEIIPNLASEDGTWAGGGLEFWVSLREGITFHDGYKFNASAVKWGFDRLAYLMNITGDLDSSCYYGIPTILHSLYEWWDGTPIINRTEIINEYVVKFVLNKPYGAFKVLLCFRGSYILSPLSTPATDYINPNTGDLVGTGPFVYEGANPGNWVDFSAYENYWRGIASIEQMSFTKIQDTDTRHNALSNGIIHFLEEVHISYIDTFKADGNITVLDTGRTSPLIQYMGINNRRFNITWRNAFSYAFDYSGVIDVLLEGYAERLLSPVPPGVTYHNNSYNCPTYNLATARSYMQSMGYGVDFTTDAQWEAATFLTINYTYNVGNYIREGVRDIVMDNFDKIGVVVEDAGVTWEQYKDRLYNRRQLSHGWDSLELWWLGRIPDYNDPENFINPMFSNISGSNACQVNDPYLETLMAAGIEETDEDMRRTLYWEMQRYIVEDLRPWMSGYVPKLITAHDNSLTGFQQNGFSILDFYSCEWKPYNYEISINSPADISFVKGETGYEIIWNLDTDHLLNPIYNITVNGILNETDSWQSGIPITVNLDHLSPGSYTYQITAKNENKIGQDTVIVIVNDLELIINHPEDITFTEGSTGITITWIITTNLEINPTYDFYINNILSDSDSWHSGIPIIVNLNNLTVGSYEYYINASNGEKFVEDTVIVNVNAKTQEDGTITLLIIIGGSIGAGIVVILTIILIRKRRK